MTSQILVVEDDLDISRNLAELLESEGFGVLTAKNGKDALDLLDAAENLPNLIILDLMMPVMDGLTFLEIKKNNSKLSKVPVVVMTADGHVDVNRLRLGEVGLIRKPSDLDTMLKVIGRYIQPAAAIN